MKSIWTSFSPVRSIPYLVLFIAPCLLLWRTVALGLPFVPSALLFDVHPWKGQKLVPWDPISWDGVAEFYPWRLFTSETLRHGHIPFWNPHQFCGTPFIANSQSAVFYPPNLLFVAFPVTTAFMISVVAHLFLTGLFLYIYLRSDLVHLSRTSALIGALTWQLCNWQVSWLALPTFLCVSCWLPLAFIAVDWVLKSPSVRRASGLGAVLGTILLAGHLQIALYCLLLTVSYSIFRILMVERGRTESGMRRYIVAATVAAIMMFALAAPQLLPSVELSGASHRAGALSTWGAYTGYNHLAVPVYHLISLFLPGFFGSPGDGSYWGATNYAENACYIGIIGLVLSVGACVLTLRGNGMSGQCRLLTYFFGGAALISLLMACGAPLNALLFFLIPGFKQSGSPGRILVLWSFCAAVLAGFGAEVLLKSMTGRVKEWLVPLLLGMIAVKLVVFGWGLVALSLAIPGKIQVALSSNVSLLPVPIGLIAICALLVWLTLRGSLSQPALRVLLVALVGLDLLTASLNLNTLLARQVYPRTALIDYLVKNTGDQRIMPVNRRWSIDPDHPPDAVLPPNAATVYGLDDVQGYDSLFTGRYMQYAASMDGGSPAPVENGNMVFTYGYRSPLTREAAVKYVISDVPLPTSEELDLETTRDNCYIYVNKETLPKYWDNSGSVESVQEISPSHLTLRVSEGPGENRLMMADQWYPGWHARINGLSVPIDQEPDIFRTITWMAPIKDAGHVVTLDVRFEPASIRLGLYLAFAAIGVLFAFAGLSLGPILKGRLLEARRQ